MGEVYLAEQKTPIKRRVALKLIKMGMDTKEVIARFESERQALAMMNHPNVARIFDAGSTDTGRPYFAMEHVPGEPITTYCDRHKLDIRSRLELFIPVCQAIHHAHQKGIIHRDIKPSNVLVAVEGGKPVPKVIDFGVAKATQQALTEKTIFTMQGKLVGTPAYMSPEQAEMTGLNVDTTSDVYSLGVLLYELLVGAQPFDAQQLREAGIVEIHRIIREVDPPKPSTRIGTLGKSATESAARRRVEPRAWQKLLHGELDWITMRAMEKDRSRRYQSAYAFAEDVDRYLRHEAISASPPSRVYKFRKFTSRHKGGAAFAVTVLILLIGFGVSMGILREKAEKARDNAQARALELEQVTAFQASMLSGIDTEEMGHALYADLRERVVESLATDGTSPVEMESALAAFDQMLRRANATDVALELLDEQVLNRAVETLEKEFSEQPLVRAALQQTLSISYREIGRYPPAVPLQEAALDTRRRVLGDDHSETLKSINSMGELLFSMGKPDEALAYYREALEGSRRVLGDDHSETLHSINNMGDILHWMDKLDEALVYRSQALEGQRRVLGDDHPETLNSINNMGLYLQSMGRLDEALVYYREALEGRRRVLGDNHPRTLISIGSMGNILKAMGKLDEALPYYLETLEGRLQALGDDHPKTLLSISLVGVLLKSMGRLDEAIVYLREALDGGRRAVGDDHPATLQSIIIIGRLLLDQSKPEEATALLEPAEAAARRAFTGDGALPLGIFLTVLGRSHAATGAFDAGQTNLNEADAILREAPGVETDHRKETLTNLVELYEGWHVAEPGAGYDRKAAEWRSKLAEL
jgi:non-specific serine/threonine protein kinase/serine/threonine-protein kinase